MQQKLCAVFMAVFIVVFKWENSVTPVEGMSHVKVFSWVKDIMFIFVSMIKACES